MNVHQFTCFVFLVTLLASSSLENAKGDLIINGDFESGNTGFTSQHAYTPDGNWGAGEYTVTDNPQSWNTNFSPIPDHTSGTGNMLVVNGSSTANLYLWQQSVSVSPNVEYEFSSWIATVFASNPAVLTVEINGEQIGESFAAPSDAGTWDNWTATWNSDTATTADIRIFNLNIDATGNDFAVDDISFSAIPEPSAFAVLGIVAVGLITQRRRRSKGL